MERQDKPNPPTIEYHPAGEDQALLRSQRAKRFVAVLASIIFGIIAAYCFIYARGGRSHVDAGLAAAAGSAFCLLVGIGRIR